MGSEELSEVSDAQAIGKLTMQENPRRSGECVVEVKDKSGEPNVHGRSYEGAVLCFCSNLRTL